MKIQPFCVLLSGRRLLKVSRIPGSITKEVCFFFQDAKKLQTTASPSGVLKQFDHKMKLVFLPASKLTTDSALS